jgi:hypothetical protein
MNRRTALRATVVLPLALRAGPAAQRQAESDWVPLFNGADLTGWETFLGKPHRTVDLPDARDGGGEYVAPVGVDRDPRGVFSVVHADGAPQSASPARSMAR